MSVSCILQGQDNSGIKLDGQKFIQEFEDVTEEVKSAVGVDALQTTIDTHIADKENPHNVTAKQTGAIGEEDIGNLYLWEKSQTIITPGTDGMVDETPPTKFVESSFTPDVISCLFSHNYIVDSNVEVWLGDIESSCNNFSEICDYLNSLPSHRPPTFFTIESEPSSNAIPVYRLGDYVASSLPMIDRWFEGYALIGVSPTIPSTTTTTIIGYPTSSSKTTYPSNGSENGYDYKLKGQIGALLSF